MITTIIVKKDKQNISLCAIFRLLSKKCSKERIKIEGRNKYNDNNRLIIIEIGSNNKNEG